MTDCRFGRLLFLFRIAELELSGVMLDSPPLLSASLSLVFPPMMLHKNHSEPSLERVFSTQKRSQLIHILP